MLHNFRTLCASLILSSILFASAVRAADGDAGPSIHNMRGALLASGDATEQRLQQLMADGLTAAVIVLTSESEEAARQEQAAADRVRRSGLGLFYWVEVARCTELADAHPEWMASLQGHSEWRRHFPLAATPAENEVVKIYPWVTILSKETYAAQLARVQQVLANKPASDGVFLNDLQGAPSACGCGNSLCRWTSDYGPKRSTTPLNDDAAANFVAEVCKFVTDCPVIPVWTTECEEHDGALDGLCAGVGCFKGICWKAYAKQLIPVSRTCSKLAVLVPYREFHRDLSVYGERAGWIRHAIGTFQSVPPKQHGQAITPSRLIPVLQGWDAGETDIATQIQVVTKSGCDSYIVAYSKIEQRWEPKLVKWR